MRLLEVKSVKKVYTSRFGGNKVIALNNVNFSVDHGEYVAIMGESGAGKTTLLNLLATLDKASEGQILLNGKDLSQMNEKEAANFRRKHLGFVFQDFNLLDTFSLRDNIYLPLLEPIAKQLHITDILDKFPYEVSGGQKQRAAVARALITHPDILLADEPTGALDSKSSSEMLEQFEAINRMGQTILMVTHSTSAASHAKRVLFIKDGTVFHQIYRGDKSEQEMYESISLTLTRIQAGE